MGLEYLSQMPLKQKFRHLLGPGWAILVRLRRSKLARTASALPRTPVRLLRQRRNHPYFPINLSGAMGMGAVIVHVLRLLRHAERHGLTPIIRVTNPLYAD